MPLTSKMTDWWCKRIGSSFHPSVLASRRFLSWAAARTLNSVSIRCLFSALDHVLHIDHNVRIFSKAGNLRPFSRQTNIPNNQRTASISGLADFGDAVEGKESRSVMKCPQGISNLDWLGWTMNSQNEMTARHQNENLLWNLSLYESCGFGPQSLKRQLNFTNRLPRVMQKY